MGLLGHSERKITLKNVLPLFSGYDVPLLSEKLDWISVMVYDYHGQWDEVTGHVAPMYEHPDDIDKTFNSVRHIDIIKSFSTYTILSVAETISYDLICLSCHISKAIAKEGMQAARSFK